MRLSILTVMPDPTALRRTVDARLPRFLDELEGLVNIDCGSYTPDGVNRVAAFVAAALGDLGAEVERSAHVPSEGQTQLGDVVVGRIPGDGPRVLLIGHMDTVFEAGTVAERPFRSDGRACPRAGRDRHEGRAAGRAACRRGAA